MIEVVDKWQAANGVMCIAALQQSDSRGFVVDNRRAIDLSLTRDKTGTAEGGQRARTRKGGVHDNICHSH